MKTSEECIQWCNMFLNDTLKTNVEDCNFLKSIKELLKRNNLVEPVVYPETKHHYKFEECGVCGIMLNNGAKFCHRCGQAVKRK